ncbi:MAG: hypothetical protein WC686_04845 [Candidatus Shapirobacteria bacterium]|jgi:hypothetical protein
MKKKTDVSRETLKIINRQQMKPIPKWEFLVKNWVTWTGLTISLIILTLGAGLWWFGVISNTITPYLWIAVALIFLAGTYLLFEKTKHAYRYQKWQIVMILVIVGLVAGGGWYVSGTAGRIDKNLEGIPYYRKVVPMKMEIWNRPEEGYLSGEIIYVTDMNNFEIRDFGGKEWTITGQNVVIRGRIKIAVSEEIKLIGEETGKNQFVAREIRPWEGRRN